MGYGRWEASGTYPAKINPSSPPSPGLFPVRIISHASPFISRPTSTLMGFYGALLVPYTRAYSIILGMYSFVFMANTFLPLARLFLSGATFFYRRDFFFLARLFLSGATFFLWRDFFLLARLFFPGATLFSLARLFLSGATFFRRRDFFSPARLFLLFL